jgi:hypothetical protein
VLLDANIIIALKLLPGELEVLRQHELDDLAALRLRAEPIVRSGLGEVPANVWQEVQARSKRYQKPENLTYTLTYDPRIVATFRKEYAKALLPLDASVSDVDVSLVAEAWKERKLIASLDWWVLGKAQAMGLAHPDFVNGRFGRADTDDRRQAAFDAWLEGIAERRTRRR